ncbi:ParA family protein [Spiroplasma endosymbiont of Lariophagus distinguendus]|uniref:ParA family protein n=1 Tax=Spiroplasma endosymbiont of Lariophagus distinguendus TaxID=2935082 RepID=UPI00207AE99B|nr:ParA family protein [Spiroplasma endosymbiont of Lariophagus distinguendus]
MKMISFCNKKGGVGKTTLCKNVAYKFALENKKVLLIDLDPQATLSVQFYTNKIVKDVTLLKMFGGFNVGINNIIQKTKYQNIDIIIAGEELTKSSTILNNLYVKENIYKVGKNIFNSFNDVFLKYDYVLIDYPPTVLELAINFLIISDLIMIPINNGIGSFKGILDLKNTLNYICRQENITVPNLRIIFNNVKEDEDTIEIYKLLEEEKLNSNLSQSVITNSKSFIKTENKLNSIWENKHYWRQKNAYEELIKEIM